jgi:LacI family transcriptional regulator
VLLDRRATGPDQCSVAVDDVQGGRLAADHLLERGHRRIAFIGGSSGLPQVQERHEGVEAAVREIFGSTEYLTVLSPETLTVAGGREAGARIVGMPAAQRPTAAVCANDLIALGLLQSLVVGGRMLVPDEIAIIGFDDISFASAAAVPLSSMRQPSGMIGRTALRILLEETADRELIPRQTVFLPELVVRRSTDPVAERRRA